MFTDGRGNGTAAPDKVIELELMEFMVFEICLLFKRLSGDEFGHHTFILI